MRNYNRDQIESLLKVTAGRAHLQPTDVSADYLDGWLSVSGLLISVFLLDFYFSGFCSNPTLSISILGISLVTAVYFAVLLHQRRPWSKALRLTEEGVVYPKFSGNLIPWSSIEHIGALELDTRAPNWRIDIRLSEKADASLKAKATKKWAIFTHAPGKANISISNVRFADHSYIEVAALMGRYHRMKAPPTAYHSSTFIARNSEY